MAKYRAKNIHGGEWPPWSHCDCDLKRILNGSIGDFKYLHPVRDETGGLLWESREGGSIVSQHQFSEPSLLEQELIASEIEKQTTNQKKKGK